MTQKTVTKKKDQGKTETDFEKAAQVVIEVNRKALEALKNK